MTFCHGRRTVPRATLTMTKSHGQKIGWDIGHTHVIFIIFISYHFVSYQPSMAFHINICCMACGFTSHVIDKLAIIFHFILSSEDVMGGKRSWLNYKLGCRLGITQPQPQSQSTDFIKRISLVVTPEQGNYRLIWRKICCVGISKSAKVKIYLMF